MSETTTVIENHTDRAIYLPAVEAWSDPEDERPDAPIYNWSDGIRLVPGPNNVPDLYLKAYLSIEVDTVNTPKTGKRRKPGAENLAALQKPTNIYSYNGNRFGPQITVYPKGAAVDENKVLPRDLSAMRDEQALAAIDVINDRSALERYSKDPRPKIATAAKSKLGRK